MMVPIIMRLLSRIKLMRLLSRIISNGINWLTGTSITGQAGWKAWIIQHWSVRHWCLVSNHTATFPKMIPGAVFPLWVLENPVGSFLKFFELKWLFFGENLVNIETLFVCECVQRIFSMQLEWNLVTFLWTIAVFTNCFYSTDCNASGSVVLTSFFTPK